MGYESTLIFGTYSPPTERHREAEHFEEYGTYFQIVATLDLAVMGDGGEFARLRKEAPSNTDRISVYYTDWDNGEQQDPYGETFKILDPHALLAALKKDAGDYRRALLAIPIVQAWIDHLHLFPGATILHYGH